MIEIESFVGSDLQQRGCEGRQLGDGGNGRVRGRWKLLRQGFEDQGLDVVVAICNEGEEVRRILVRIRSEVMVSVWESAGLG